MKRRIAFCVFAISMLILSGCGGDTTTTAPTTTTPTTTPSSQMGDSITRPAPIGATVAGIIECGMGYTSHELYDVKVTLIEVLRGDEAWQDIEAASGSNEPPDAGFEYVLARIKFEFYARGLPGDLSHQLIREQFISYSAVGLQYDDVSVVPPDPELNGELYDGDFLEGWVVLQVAEDDDKPLMNFDAGVGGAELVEHGGNLWFQLY